MGNKIKYGLKNAHYAVITETAGVPSYATPVPIPGAVNILLPASGEKSEFYADDCAYFEKYSNNGYEGSLEIALIPDSFNTDVLGEAVDDNGAIIENANAIIKNFALMFEFQGDVNAVRHVLYNCNVSRPEIKSATKTKTVDPQTDTLNLAARPAVDTGNVKAKLAYGKTGYSTFFSAVYLEDAPTNTIDKATETFSKAAPADVVLTVTSTGTPGVVNVRSNGALVPGVKLSIAGLAVTIDDAYFSALANGTYAISIELSTGNAVSCVVTVAA